MYTFSTRSTAIITTALTTGLEIEKYLGNGESYTILEKNEDYYF